VADSPVMASPTTPPVPSGHDDDPDSRSGSRVALVATLTAVAVLLGGWIYVLFLYDPGLMIDELADRTFPTQAEQVCAAAKDELEQLPPADLAASASERADVVARSNVILSGMIADLRPLAPTEPQQVADGVDEWLDDWTTYLGNRERYVENLRVDDEARFLETTKGSDTKGITRAINSFAQVNRMDSCTTPADLS
jgi:hypothetical protein